MTVSVETMPVPEGYGDLMCVRVKTEDAAGSERRYDIRLFQDEIDGEHIMGGSRADDDAPDEPAGGGVSRRAYEAAAARFKAAGYEVFGR